MRHGLIGVIAGTLAVMATTCVQADQWAVRQLRCEYLVNPAAVDVAAPRLSWIVTSQTRGQRQTVYQVLVASSAERLAADQGDLWDSGQVQSDATAHIAYAGKTLASRTRCFWKVQAWDKDGKPSAWSEPATWTMGLLAPADWRGARWIAASGKAASEPPKTPHNGYHSVLAPSADVTKWVGIDLGSVQKVDAVRLHPARPFDFTDTPGFLFPVRFRIEVADKPDFADARVVVDQTAQDVPNPGTDAPWLRFTPVEGRFVRLVATRLRQRDPGNFGLAMAEMEVFSNGETLARGKNVLAADSSETGGWAAEKLVDGRLLAEPGNAGAKPEPATMLRKDFALPGAIKRATLHATGLGLYELSINGARVGENLLAPEWTLYSKRIQYQTYDVTKMLANGPNAIGAQLGEGWYAGPLMFRPAIPNPVFRLLLCLDIEMADRSTRTIVSDGSWRGTTDGPIRESGIYAGETYDARREMPGWDRPGFDAAAWKPVQTIDDTESPLLVAQPNEPIRVVEELQPIKLTEPKPGAYVFDLGQNMVGWCRVKLRGPKGTTVTLRHAERLNDDGTVYTANLRSAPQIDHYTLRGNGEEVFEPHFTYHGFRYLELTGLPSPPRKDDVLGRVFYSNAPQSGNFECSSPLLNQLMRNIFWTQRANLESAPTDCPQRDERFGWMGDIQSFSQTAIFNMDMAAFFTKWVSDIRDSQQDDGRFPDFAPNAINPNKTAPGLADKTFSGVPAWGDAGVIVPWRMYQNYGDRRILQQHFAAARRWVDFIHRNNPDLLWVKSRGNDYGDWLNGDTLILEGYPKGISEMPKEVLATAFFAHSTELVGKIARAIGREDDAAKYGKLADNIKAAFRRAYVAPDGRIKGDTQAGYALALRFDLLEPTARGKAVEHLLEAIARYKGHPSTGIQTTHRMMLELSERGRHDEAWRLVNLRTIPSWGFMIDQDATTIWERWDGYVPGRGYQGPGMNSFNHWALGSVGEWVWRELVGLNPDDDQPGFKHFILRPRPAGDLTWVRGRYDSIRGPIACNWKIADGRITLDVTVPANTTATVYVPTSDPAQVTESGRPAAEAPGVRSVTSAQKNGAVYEVGSGRYTFVGPWGVDRDSSPR